MVTTLLIIVSGIGIVVAIVCLIKQNKLISDIRTSKQNVENELSNAREKVLSLETKIEYEQTSNSEHKNKVSTLENDLRDTREKYTASVTEKNFLQEQHQNSIKQIEEIRSAMKLEFENLANRIFTDNSKNFKSESENRLGEILSPLKSEIEKFKSKLENSFTEQTKQQSSLKNEIERIVKVNEKMSMQTDNLTNALKGDFRIQGNWGEFVLERILEDSGLRHGEDYVLQASQMNVKHADENTRLKPDVIVKLPENKHIIIDSKVSLTDYEKYHSETDEIQKSIHLKQFINSIKNHINDLQSKRYQDAEQLTAPDFVLMFMPIESAYCLATKNDQDLHQHAWNKKIIIVCPTTLYSTLRTIASIWKVELQQKHSLEIANQGRAIYEKVCGFVEDILDLGKHLKRSQDSYDNSLKKLSTGKGNILIRTQKLDELGVKTSKKLLKLIPEAFVDEENDEPDEHQKVGHEDESTFEMTGNKDVTIMNEFEESHESPF